MCAGGEHKINDFFCFSLHSVPILKVCDFFNCRKHREGRRAAGAGLRRQQRQHPGHGRRRVGADVAAPRRVRAAHHGRNAGGGRRWGVVLRRRRQPPPGALRVRAVPVAEQRAARRPHALDGARRRRSALAPADGAGAAACRRALVRASPLLGGAKGAAPGHALLMMLRLLVSGGAASDCPRGADAPLSLYIRLPNLCLLYIRLNLSIKQPAFCKITKIFTGTRFFLLILAPFPFTMWQKCCRKIILQFVISHTLSCCIFTRFYTFLGTFFDLT